MKNDFSYVYGVAEGKLKEDAIKLHIERYLEVGFFKKNEFDPYQNKSLYFTVNHIDSEDVVGVTRLIFDKLEDLPTIKNFQIYDIEKARIDQLDKSRYAEFSAFTKMPAHDVGLGLVKAVFQYSAKVGISHWICCVDERVFNYINRVFKFPFRIIGEPQVYMGSKTIPCVLILDEILATIKEERVPLYEYFIAQQSKYLEAIND
jgi:N-acyl-L-homoserine lactone synthetase